jgi:hypothetical protein
MFVIDWFKSCFSSAKVHPDVDDENYDDLWIEYCCLPMLKKTLEDCRNDIEGDAYNSYYKDYNMLIRLFGKYIIVCEGRDIPEEDAEDVILTNAAIMLYLSRPLVTPVML